MKRTMFDLWINGTKWGEQEKEREREKVCRKTDKRRCFSLWAQLLLLMLLWLWFRLWLLLPLPDYVSSMSLHHSHPIYENYILTIAHWNRPAIVDFFSCIEHFLCVHLYLARAFFHHSFSLSLSHHISIYLSLKHTQAQIYIFAVLFPEHFRQSVQLLFISNVKCSNFFPLSTAFSCIKCSFFLFDVSIRC